MTERIENINIEADKYRVEFSRGTSGGKIGFSVRAVGAEKGAVLVQAQELAEEAKVVADSLSAEGK